MGRKPKIPIQAIQAMEDVRPDPRPMYPPNISGGSICAICRKEVDKCCEEMEGAGISKVVGKVKRGTKRVGKATGEYITNTDGLLSDVVNYGLPSAAGATLGALGAATGNPMIGIAASALGSKLGTMAADKIADETLIQSRTGEGIKPKRKSRFAKGSQEALDHMKMLREKRQKK
jgi:hypothetical protein